jgi:superfamily II DNA or RNA helicase
MICFCASIEQANELGGNGNIVHSKVKDVDAIIENFQTGRIDSLYCVEMLKEGMNLNDINAGVIIQLDGTELPFIQKMGRILRSKQPVVHIVYYKNTRDEEYLNNILESVDRKYIEFV